MLQWKDISSYSRNDKERTPTVLELRVDGLRIVIHRIIHYPEWYVSCYDLNIEDKCLYTEDLEEAKAIGIQTIIDKIEELERAKSILIGQ